MDSVLSPIVTALAAENATEGVVGDQLTRAAGKAERDDQFSALPTKLQRRLNVNRISR